MNEVIAAGGSIGDRMDRVNVVEVEGIGDGPRVVVVEGGVGEGVNERRPGYVWRRPEPGMEWKGLYEEFCRYRNDLSEESKYCVKRTVWGLVDWLAGRPLTGLELQRYQDWLKGRSTPANVWQQMKLIRGFTAWLVEARYLKVDPSLGVGKVRVYQKEPRDGFTAEEYRKLRDYGDADLSDLCVVQFHTGLSMVDACELLWGEVDLEGMMIRRARRKMATRTGARQYVPIVRDTDLHRLLVKANTSGEFKTGAGNLVFPRLHAMYWSNRSRRRSGQFLRMRLHRACLALGITPKGSHGFRRGFLTALASDVDANLINVSRVSGHGSVDMLKRYVKPDVEKIRESVRGAMERHFSGVREADVKEEREGEKDGARVSVDWRGLE